MLWLLLSPKFSRQLGPKRHWLTDSFPLTALLLPQPRGHGTEEGQPPCWAEWTRAHLVLLAGLGLSSSGQAWTRRSLNGSIFGTRVSYIHRVPQSDLQFPSMTQQIPESFQKSASHPLKSRKSHGIQCPPIFRLINKGLQPLASSIKKHTANCWKTSWKPKLTPPHTALHSTWQGPRRRAPSSQKLAIFSTASLPIREVQPPPEMTTEYVSWGVRHWVSWDRVLHLSTGGLQGHSW